MLKLAIKLVCTASCVITWLVLQVHIVTNNNNLNVVSQPLRATESERQMGEYFGFSLLAADLDGDE